MGLWILLFTAMMLGGTAFAQEPPTASPAPPASSARDSDKLNLPVSLDRIRMSLEQPGLRGMNLADQPTFRLEVRERNRLQDLIASLDFKAGPVPAGGLVGAEQQRVMFPTTNNPLQQPYAAFSQSELLTVLAENLAGKYLLGRALGSLTRSERAQAEAAAREEVRHAVEDYCAVQPNAGVGIRICSTPSQ